MKKSWLICLSVMVLAGCQYGTRDLERWVSEVRQRPPTPLDPLPPIVEPEPFAYTAHDLRDPFIAGRSEEEQAEEQALAQGEERAGPQPDFERRREYLEEYPLDALDMVGTMEMEVGNWALVKDTDGVVHRIGEGSYMGQNHGRVVEVAPDRVNLLELVPDGAGGWLEREAIIALSES